MYCKCGCNKITNIHTRNRKSLSHIRGEHKDYYLGHSPVPPHNLIPIETKKIDEYGYVHIKESNVKWSAEHRVIASKILGRSLKVTEIVHHIDENPFNNENSNLLICNVSYHMCLHKRMRRVKRIRRQTGRPLNESNKDST